MKASLAAADREKHDFVASMDDPSDSVRPVVYWAMVFDAPQSLLFGQFLFKVVRKLGQGGLGTVDEVEITASNCEYPVGMRLARKRLHATWAQNPAMAERFEREISALRTMSHPSILSLKGENFHGSSERCYFMPVYPRTAREYLNGRGGTPWLNVADFGASIADALAYAHGRGHIHRDLKPENLLLTEKNTPIIADWGLGYFVHQYSVVLLRLTVAGMGTEYYCSAEQWMTGKCKESGDVYSLGMTLAEIATGSREALSFPGEGIRRPVVGGSRGADHFALVLQRMTSMAPSARLQSMTAVAAELRTAMALGL